MLTVSQSRSRHTICCMLHTRVHAGQRWSAPWVTPRKQACMHNVSTRQCIQHMPKEHYWTTVLFLYKLQPCCADRTWLCLSYNHINPSVGVRTCMYMTLPLPVPTSPPENLCSQPYNDETVHQRHRSCKKLSSCHTIL